MSKISLSARRAKAERRFQWYGRCAIGSALLALSLLLVTLIAQGWQGFFHTEIRLQLAFDANEISMDPIALRHADISPALKRALLARFPFPGVAEHRALRELMGLLSSGAAQEVRNALLRNPSQAKGILTLWLPASDAVDRAIKDGTTSATAQTQRKITDQQLAWLNILRKDKAVRSTWNKYFFNRGDSREPELAGFAGSMTGSFLTLLCCMLMAFPVGVMAAIYLEEFAAHHRLTDWIEITINNLAAVPSVVFGLLGLAVYLNLFGIPRSASLAGGLTLALMILPTIIITTRASLRAIPDSIRDAARALGASPLQVVLHHTLPLSIPGIMTGTILGLARAMGETAPLLMIGMVAFVADIPRDVLEPATSMPVQIYLWATSPEASFVEKTSAGILVLLVVLVMLNSLAIYVRKKYEQRW
jgi:phosphate transport system permease protein